MDGDKVGQPCAGIDSQMGASGSTRLQQLLMTGSTLGQVFLPPDKWWINLAAAATDDWINLGTGIAAA
jgi:hypothetical protein